MSGVGAASGKALYMHRLWTDYELLFPNLVRDGLPINQELIGLLRWFQTPELWLKTRSVRLWVLCVFQQLCLILRGERFCFWFELRLSVLFWVSILHIVL
jgi:hypothetical protein